jgi:hypothetical protein
MPQPPPSRPVAPLPPQRRPPAPYSYPPRPAGPPPRTAAGARTAAATASAPVADKPAPPDLTVNKVIAGAGAAATSAVAGSFFGAAPAPFHRVDTPSRVVPLRACGAVTLGGPTS